MLENGADSEARERILQKAEELFYAQGLHATGINQIIDQAKVAKATFYAHFPSKDELCLAYAKRVSDRELKVLEKELARRSSPKSKYMAPIELLEPWLVETNLRGCTFLNLVPEVPDFESPIRQVGVKTYDAYRTAITRCVKLLSDTAPDRYGRLNAKKVASEYLSIFAGSIALCEIFHDIEPLRTGIKMVEALLD